MPLSLALSFNSQSLLHLCVADFGNGRRRLGGRAEIPGVDLRKLVERRLQIVVYVQGVQGVHAGFLTGLGLGRQMIISLLPF